MVTNRPGDWRERGRSSAADEGFGGRVGSRLRDVGRTLVSDQKNRACEELESISEVAHEAADRLHERDDHLIADSVDALADEMEKAAEFVREHSLNEMLDRVSSFARKSPELFLGGSLLLGLVAGRFLKASSREASPYSSSFGTEQRRSGDGVKQPGGGYETHTSEAGPITTPPRSGQSEQLNPGSAQQPQGFHRPTDTPRAISEHEARESEAGTEGIHGSRVRLESEGDRDNEPYSGPDIRARGGRDFEQTERESQERNP